LAALSHQDVDRVPIGFYAIDCDTIEKLLGHETFLRAKARSQIAFWEGMRDEVVRSWKNDLIELHKKLPQLDIVNLAAMATGIVPPKDYRPDPPQRLDENTWKDDEGRVYKYSPITADITIVKDLVAERRVYTLEDFNEEEVSKPNDSIFEVVDAVIDEFRGKKFIIGPSNGTSAMIMLGGNYEQGLRAYHSMPEVVRKAIARQVSTAEKLDQFMLKPGYDAVMDGEDYATTAGPMLSPATFRSFCLPALQRRIGEIHRRGFKFIKHACGNNWLLMDMFVEAGFDCYQSIQESAGMDLKLLKERYGKKLALWGGVMLEHLWAGTPDDVRKDVANAIRYGAPGGGFILGTSHSVAIGTRYENFLAMLESHEKMGALSS